MSAADHPHDDRLAQLESKLAFLEHTVEVLSSELETQQSETRMLLKKLQGLQEHLESLGRDAGIGDSPDEPPPHY
jgi:SlyX protein